MVASVNWTADPDAEQMLFAVRTEGKWGYINCYGKMVIQPDLDDRGRALFEVAARRYIGQGFPDFAA